MEPNRIFELLRERIVAFAASRYRREHAEDVAQEVLQLLYEKYAHVTAPEELVPLALKIARFKIVAGIRTSIRHGESTQMSVEDLPLADTQPDPAVQAERKETVARLHAALATLGDRCRKLFRYKLEGKSFAEIQTLLEAPSINTIYTWDLRCRKQLREAIGGSWEGKR